MARKCYHYATVCRKLPYLSRSALRNERYALRAKLYEAIECYGMTDEATIKVSQQLDDVLMKEIAVDYLLVTKREKEEKDRKN